MARANAWCIGSSWPGMLQRRGWTRAIGRDMLESLGATTAEWRGKVVGGMVVRALGVARSFTLCRALRSERTERRTTMPVIKVTDLAYGKLQSPDLDAQEEFLTHFGMVRADRTPNALYMRGTDPAHHIHVTEKGDPGFIGMAYYAASEEDLHTVARVPGVSGVEDIDEPGG